jgi:DNA ligase-1
MLAHTFDPMSGQKRSKKNGIVFPCYVQPKLDGLRCICVMDANGKIWLQSRTGSYFENLGHLYAELTEIFQKYPGIVLDGELYTTDMPFEELAGLIKKKKLDSEGNDKARLAKVKYHLYDCILPSYKSHNSFEFRWRELRSLVSPDYTELKFVETERCNDLETFRDFFAAFVQEGFEGIMLRNQGGQYRENYRSHDLQKYKEFVENEYEITGFTEGDGRDKGAIIWMCKIPVSNTIFNVRPKGTMEYRRALYTDASQHPAKYIGKMLTVIYQELSEHGVPRFPVGKAVREDY